jgi:pyruvate kinase
LITVTPRSETVLELSLSWGIDAIAVEAASSTQEMVDAAVAAGLAAGRIAVDETVIVIAGHPDSPSGAASDLVRAVQIR